jgi:hypothetical protein
MRLMRMWGVGAVLILPCCGNSSSSAPTSGDVEITFYRLQGPGGDYDIKQASGLHYGQLGGRDGLWIVCDRNGGRSAGRLFYVSRDRLTSPAHRSAIEADEVFEAAAPAEGWEAFATRYAGAGERVLDEVRRRVESGGGSGPFLDLEAVTIGPSPAKPDEQHVFVAAEEPYSAVLELSIEGSPGEAKARLVGLYTYDEAEEEHGTDRNDGLEGLAYAGRGDDFYWQEEGTRFHDGPPGPRLYFLDPRLGRAKLRDGRMMVERTVSEELTRAVHGQRSGRMQTLNGMALAPDGRLLAVDRNGGWVLRVDPAAGTAQRWLNLYDLSGVNLREALAEFPGERSMPYISIEGIAVDRAGRLWMVDDPAMPENFRASCLVRVTGLGLEKAEEATTRPATTTAE